MKLLAFLILIYLGYRLARGYLSSGPRRVVPDPSRPRPGEIDDIMVKDPACGVYFPKRDGIRVQHEGNDYYFCSPACRDRFLERHAEKRDG
jgi:YHS domain-containing protein